jgi:hypothetical protein
VNEVGLGIVSDAASMERQRRVANSRRLDPRQPNVDGLGLHVQTVFRDPGGVSAIQPAQQIQQPRIIVMHVAGAMIPQNRSTRTSASGT